MTTNLSIERKDSRLIGSRGHVVLPAPFVVHALLNKNVSVQSAVGVLIDLPLSQVLEESDLTFGELHIGMSVNLDQSTECQVLRVFEDDTLEVSVNDSNRRIIVLIENMLSWRCVKTTHSKLERESRLKGRHGHVIVPTPFTIESIFNTNTHFGSVNVVSIANPNLAFNMPIDQLIEESGVAINDLHEGMQVYIKHGKECQVTRVYSDDTLDVRITDSNQQTNVLIEKFFFYD
jgi:hypothetical protein